MFAAVDIGGTKTLVAVFDAEGEIVEKIKFPTPNKYAEFKKELAKNPNWVKDLNYFESYDKARIRHFANNVYAFTPKGDVVDLPLNSSPIDFAYAIHSGIGDHVFGAKVNGKLVSLDTVLHNGDIVEIQTKKNAQPKQKWLDFAKTTIARRHIRNALENENKR